MNTQDAGTTYPTESPITIQNGTNNGTFTYNGITSGLASEVYIVALQGVTSGTCNDNSNVGNDYIWLEGDGSYTVFSFLEPLPVQEVTGFQQMLNEGESVYAQTTGTTMGATVIWAGSSVTSVFIGSALSILYFLRFWIVALIIIYLIVFFYKRFKMHRV